MLRHFAKRALLPLFIAAIAGGPACESDAPTEPVASAENTAPRFKHHALYDRLSAQAEYFTQANGNWVEDYGDAPFYGLAFYTWEGKARGNQSWLDRSAAARVYALETIAGANLLTDDVNEIAMSALGLIDYVAATGDQAPVAAIEALIKQVNTLAGALGWYINVTTIDSWAFDTYGPTSITGLVALLNVQYALLIGGAMKDDAIAATAQYQAAIEDKTYEGSRYKFGPDRDGLFLYPNVTMILFHARVFELTGDEAQKTRALELYQAVQSLRVDDDNGRVRYRSPYSAEYMGAKTDDYTTLSSQNYLMFALMMLHKVTGDSSYLTEMDSVLEALDQELYGEWCHEHLQEISCNEEFSCTDEQVCVANACQADSCHGGVLHHWMDGGVAVPADVEFFCTGCNLQLLYLMWYRQAQIDTPLAD